MAFQDVYEVVDEQLVNGQEVLNVYFYENNNALNGGATAEDLADSFIAEMMPLIRAAQTTVVLHTGVRVRNLYNESDQHNREISLSGLRTNTNAEPTFTAVGFTLGQNNGAIRNGAKRLAGLDDSDISNGVVTGSAAITALDALADGMEQTLSIVLAEVFMPVIVGRILDGGEYRLPENAGEAVLGAIVDAVWKALVTTQNSRKIGTGS